jgi:hypothetical protein
MLTQEGVLVQELNRINFLIDEARARCNPPQDTTVAAKLGVSPKVLSNWRTGHKTPSIDAQCELAAIGDRSVPSTALQCMLEKAEGPRKKRFAKALLQQLDLEGNNNPVLRANLEELLKDTISKTAERLARIDQRDITTREILKTTIGALDLNKPEGAAAKIALEAVMNAFPPETDETPEAVAAHWRKR